MAKMQIKVVLGILVGFALTACASQTLESYIGKSITEPMLDYGRPTNVFDLPDGTRAFQWQINSSGMMPITSPSSSTIYGSGGWASVTTTTTQYVPYENSCLYTLIAKESVNDWTVTGFRKPTFWCE